MLSQAAPNIGTQDSLVLKQSIRRSNLFCTPLTKFLIQHAHLRTKTDINSFFSYRHSPISSFAESQATHSSTSIGSDIHNTCGKFEFIKKKINLVLHLNQTPLHEDYESTAYLRMSSQITVTSPEPKTVTARACHKGDYSGSACSPPRSLTTPQRATLTLQQ